MHCVARSPLLKAEECPRVNALVVLSRAILSKGLCIVSPYPSDMPASI